MKYLLLTLRHKWFVFLAGLRTKAPLWRLLIHDWSKFLPSELPYYQRQFFGDKGDPDGFAVAWLRHQNHHPHHWEFWITRTGHFQNDCGDNVPLPMPEWAVREMVADWLGAGRAYEGKWPSMNNWIWLNRNRDRILARLHPTTIERIEALIANLASEED